jgi:hypothetical protein
MKVLIIVKGSPTQRYVARLLTNDLIEQVKELVRSKKHSEAVTAVLSQGKIESRVSRGEAPHVAAELILSDTNARWDLIK